MYTVIGSPRTRAQRVYWALEEMGLDYSADTVMPRTKTAQLNNPSGKVPSLLVDGQVINDSVAIIQFLADRHNLLTFPAGTLERAQQDSFTQFCCDEIDGPLWTAAKHSFILPEEYRIAAAKTTARFEFDRAITVLATRLADREFVMGAKLTVPDIIMGQCGFWAKIAKFEVTEPSIKAYFDRLMGRAAFQKILAWGDSLPSVIPKDQT